MMHTFWQDFADAETPGPPYGDRMSIEIGRDRFLVLPIRPLPVAGTAVASFLANQASFPVIDVLTERMVALAAGTGARRGDRPADARPRLRAGGSHVDWDTTTSCRSALRGSSGTERNIRCRSARSRRRGMASGSISIR